MERPTAAAYDHCRLPVRKMSRFGDQHYSEERTIKDRKGICIARASPVSIRSISGLLPVDKLHPIVRLGKHLGFDRLEQAWR